MPNETPKYVAVERHGMRFIHDRDNKIVLRADYLSMEQLKAMADGLSQSEEPAAVSKYENIKPFSKDTCPPWCQCDSCKSVQKTLSSPTPKSKCCDAPPQVSDPNHCSYCGYYFVARNSEAKQSLRGQWEQEADGHKPTETIYPPSKEQIAKQCTCGLHPHPQPTCPAAKQPDKMPDVIYALKDDYQTFWTPTPIDSFTPYIRKSIHDEQMIKFADKLQECENLLKSNAHLIEFKSDETTKLKSALKESVVRKSCIIHSLITWMEIVISRLDLTKTSSNSEVRLLQMSLRICIDAAIIDNRKATDAAKELYE